jgi:hypothetical protein
LQKEMKDKGVQHNVRQHKNGTHHSCSSRPHGVRSGPALAQGPAYRHPEAFIEPQIPTSVKAGNRLMFAPDQSSQMTTTYFDPSPTPFKAYTYSASVRLHPSASKRIWLGELSFPAFNGTPIVSVQIISSISAMPMQVKSLKMVENSGSSGLIETRIFVEAEPLFDGVPSGFYFANLVVTGVPLIPPVNSGSAQQTN